MTKKRRWKQICKIWILISNMQMKVPTSNTLLNIDILWKIEVLKATTLFSRFNVSLSFSIIAIFPL